MLIYQLQNTGNDNPEQCAYNDLFNICKKKFTGTTSIHPYTKRSTVDVQYTIIGYMYIRVYMYTYVGVGVTMSMYVIIVIQ